VIAIIEIASIGLVLMSDVIRLAAFDGSSISFTLNVIWVVFFGVVIALLFQAIKTENAILALPHLIYQVISIIFYFFLLIFAIVALANGSTWAMAAIGLSYDDTFYCPDNIADKTNCNKINGYIGMESRLAGCLVLIISFSLLIGFQLWVFCIVRKLYRYLNDKAKFAPNVTSAAPYDGNVSRSQSFHIHRIYTIPSHRVVVEPPPQYPMQVLQSSHVVDPHPHPPHQLPVLEMPPQQPTTINEDKTSLATSEEASDALQIEKKRDRNSSVRSLRTDSDSSLKSDSDEQ